jgi:tetratricopeptide (TPR) repeat protein
VDVLTMEEDEAVTLLLKSAMLDGTCGDARNVAKRMILELGGIPLALDQAGAYIHRSGCGIDSYFKLYQKNKHKLMSRKEFKGASGYGRSAYGTWDISFQKIEKMKESGEEAEAAQTAISLLKIFAFLNHENIPEELFQNAAENYMNSNVNTVNSAFPMTLLNHQTLFIGEGGEWDRMQFLDGVQMLLSFSLISVVNHLYAMHLLVNSWSRSCMSQTEINNHYHRARGLLSCSVVPYWNIDNHAFCTLLAPHIRSNLLHGQELRLQEKYYSHEYDRFSIVFDHIGSWNEAEKVLNTAVNERKAMLGSNHPDTLTAMNNLALTYNNQGRWDEAEKLQIQVIEEHITLGEPDYPGPFTLGILNNLALTYRDQGKYAAAEKLQVVVMNILTAQQGSDHPATLQIMANLAVIYDNQGKWNEAENLQVEVMKAQTVKLGPDYLSTLITMSNLALTYQHQGRLDEAEKLQVEVMKSQKVKLGSDHPTTLSNMNNLALTYHHQERYDEAEKLQVEVVNMRKEQLGSEHPHTLEAMVNLAATYHEQGRCDEAEKLLVVVIDSFKVKLGSDHPKTLVAMNHLAFIYQDQGRWDEAEMLQVEAMKTYKVKLGLECPETLLVMGGLALTYKHQGKYDEAASLLSQLDKVLKAKQENHWSMLDFIINLIKVLAILTYAYYLAHDWSGMSWLHFISNHLVILCYLAHGSFSYAIISLMLRAFLQYLL